MNFSALVEKGHRSAGEFISHGVETWVAEERIDQEQAEALSVAMNTPRVEAALLHLGVHFAISLPLRFPSISRMGTSIYSPFRSLRSS